MGSNENQRVFPLFGLLSNLNMQKTIRYFGSLKVMVGWILFALLLTFLIHNRHQKTGTFNWTTPLWADQAGYYVYLPSFFIYDFEADAFPEDIAKMTGDGFSFDFEKNKVVTRYTSGVAILQAPFFIFIHILAGIFDRPQDGFSGIYHQVPNLAALFYCLLGLFFLWKFLTFYYKPSIVLLTVAALFFGTNLYYYAVDSTGMSHIYSFALFAISAWLSKKIVSDRLKHHNLYFAAWSLVFAMIVLIRPTNILVFPFLFCLDCSSFRAFTGRIKQFLTVPNILILLVSSFVVFLPQFIYWKYVSGKFITDSYSGFGFTNWNSPKILELWFSPNNGLFLYSPFYLIAVYGMFLMVKNKVANGWMILTIFLVASYVFASWFTFSFGCGFGSRNYVEYVALLALPVGFVFSRISKLRLPKKIAIVCLLIFLVIFNVRLVYSYNRCFQGGDWDFREYVSFLVEIRKYHKDLELNEPDTLNSEKEYSKTLYVQAKRLAHVKYSKALVRAKVTLETEITEALLVLSVEGTDSTLFWNSLPLKEQTQANRIHKVQTIEGEFWVPRPLPINSTLAVYVWNKEKETFTLNELDVYLK